VELRLLNPISEMAKCKLQPLNVAGLKGKFGLIFLLDISGVEWSGE
jgi:hypothetical protein